jgi:5-methylcytosine-specific restriction endonuclease McrA
MEHGYASEYKNEITGIYLNMWVLAQSEAEFAVKKAEYLRLEYMRYRLLELKDMPYREYLETHEWQRTRKDALKRADRKCQLCNAEGTELHVHHKTYERRGEELPEDLIVLCKDCHAKFHDKEAK